MNEIRNEKKLQSLLSEKLEEHRIEAPEQTWNTIQTELFSTSASKRRIWFWLSAGFFFLCATLLFVNVSSKPSMALISSSKLIFLIKKKHLEKTSILTPLCIFIGNESSLENSESSHSTLSIPNSKKNNLTSEFTRFPSDLIIDNSEIFQADSFQADSFQFNLRMPYQPIFPFESTLLSVQIIPFNLTKENKTIENVSTNLPSWYIEMYAGFGRNVRTYDGLLELAKLNKHSTLINRTIAFKNRNIGFNLRKDLKPYLQLRAGFNYGVNTFTSRFFPILLSNNDLNKEIQVSSPVGELKSDNLELESAANQLSDSTSFLMRISHKSTYFQIPISLSFNSINSKGPILYGFSGLDIIFHGKEQNDLLLRREKFSRSALIQRNTERNKFNLGFNFGIGIASTSSKRLQVFSECVYSRVLGPYYSGNVLTIYSHNWQINTGLRMKM
jgi:hypothetical protein